MAMTLLQKTDMYRFFSIAFNAAPGVTYMTQLDEALASGMSTKQIVNVFTTKAEFTSTYPTFLDNATFAKKLIETVVGDSATAAAKAEAVAEVQAAISSGFSRGDVVYQIFTNLAALTTDAKWGATATMMSNKVAVAAYYTETLATDSTNLATLRGVLSNVTAATDVSTTAALATVLSGPAPVVSTSLTVGQDTLNGTSIADTFKAMVVQNSAGAQTNQLATGDQINGGAGVDTLMATVQKASALGSSPTQAITPATTSVEKAYFTALTVDNQLALNAAETVVINAKSMTGLTAVGSAQSDASLTIQNLTTLTDTGIYADRRNTDSVTIRMDHSGNDKALDVESDLTVLFDNDYLVSGKTSLSTIGYWVEDREAAKATPATPLKKIDATGVVFTINGSTPIEVKIPADSLKAFLATDGTWVGYTALLQTALTLLKTGAPAVGTTAAVAADARLANLNFSLDTANMRVLGKDGTTLPVPAPAITLSSTVGDKLVAGGFVTASEFGTTYDVFTEITNATSVSTNLPITSNIELFKAGRGAEGGDLVVGAMSTDLNNSNVWAASTSAIKQGIEKFVITVEGDATQFSSLSSLQSTNNTLKEVIVSSKAGSVAALQIGNLNTMVGLVYAPLKDVQIFNAAALEGSLTLDARITSESIGKYMTSKDAAPALAAADNVAFVYTGTKVADTMDIKIDTAVAAYSSINAIGGREDFTFQINGGAGNDKVTVAMVDSLNIANFGATPNWYYNQDLNHNFTVNGGAGDDIIKTPGAGDMKINGDAGKDTIYTDNIGQKATWVFNTANQVTAVGLFPSERNIADLRSDTNEIYNLYKSTITVKFKDLSVTVTIESANFKASDLEINQAIKAAINGNDTLKMLLSAADGPANSLVVTSLIDGSMTNADLSINLALPAAGTLTAAEIKDAGAVYLAPGTVVTEALVLAKMAESFTAFTSYGDYVTALGSNGTAAIAATGSTAGFRSFAASDNIVTGGADNDVMVLGTAVGADRATSSNDILVFGPQFGDDTVVNFTSLSTDAGVDHFDFSLIGGSVFAAATVNKSILSGNLVATPTSTIQSQVEAAFATANTAAQTHVYVALNATGTVGTVYSVVDAIGAGAVATREGSITLAGSTWNGATFLEAGFILNDGPTYGGVTAPVGPVVPAFTNSSLDTLGSDAVPGLPAVLATSGAINYTDAVGVRSNVSLLGFGADDQITITGSTALIYNTAISSAGADVTVSYNNAGTLNIINLVGVNTAGAFVNDVAGFNALAVGNLIFA